MSWDTIFAIANLLAVLAWLVLIVLPRTHLTQSIVMYVGVGLLCLAYTVLLILLQWDLVDPVPHGEPKSVSFTDISGVRAIFLSDGGVTVGWIHYLAFDLFVGTWIAKDADHKGFSRWLQAPVLLLTVVAGPAGLLWWLAMRERRARAAAGPRRIN
ncbi:ABA4-like family protein [Erythrobacter alti]|uniref:ABA4-like family protein n=1 Tax=Erythrobacter alti TaxID=1896145 RepID=UPI0030F4A1F6